MSAAFSPESRVAQQPCSLITLDGNLLERSVLFWLSITDLARLDAADSQLHSTILTSPAWEEVALRWLDGFSFAPGVLSSSEIAPVDPCDFLERRRKFNAHFSVLKQVTVPAGPQVPVPNGVVAHKLLLAVQRANRAASAHIASGGLGATVLVGNVCFPMASVLNSGRLGNAQRDNNTHTLVSSKPMVFNMLGNKEKEEGSGLLRLCFAWDSYSMYLSATCQPADQANRWYLRQRQRSQTLDESDFDSDETDSEDEDIIIDNPHHRGTLAVDASVVGQGGTKPVHVCTRDSMVNVGGDWCKARGISCPAPVSNGKSGCTAGRDAFASALVSGLTYVVCVRAIVAAPPPEVGALDRIASLNLEVPMYRNNPLHHP